MSPSSVPPILILDLEIQPQTRQLIQIAALRPDTQAVYESPKLRRAQDVQTALAHVEALAQGAHYLMGHNLLAHDLPYLRQALTQSPLVRLPVIDTLRLSPLAFPHNPYHRLIKNHKLIASALNSPLADCQACWQLFTDQCTAFAKLRDTEPHVFAVYRTLFGELPFSDGQTICLADAQPPLTPQALKQTVLQILQDEANGQPLRACMTRLARLRAHDLADPALHIPLAYTLAWLRVAGGNSVLAPWVRHQFPDTARLIRELRDQDCGNPHCRYCREILNPTAQLIRYFGQDGGITSFREIDQIEGGQEAVVRAGMNGEHLMAVLPTGGGKSLCFQLPALNRYFRNGGLTIVVSPLQSLMTDQVYNLQRRGIAGVATLNGMLTVTERADVLDKVALGDIGILFVAPEQFRNSSFIQAIEHRQINGWVFDEAHCLSKWGHDFRPDYLYAAKFIQSRLPEHAAPAPVSCFTATAKPDVLADITQHFRDTLGIELKQFIGSNERSNLYYEVLDTPRGHKHQRIHELLSRELAGQQGGAVVFAASRRRTEEISEFLKAQQWACSHFHAGLKANEKADIQQRFIDGDLRVIVATNAFGMGVDKPDVRLVIHAEIPGSLENYLQEAGRAGRDRQDAKCILLFDGQDIDTQFKLNKQSQLERRDLNSIWGRLKVLNRSDELIVSSGDILHDSSEYMSFDSDDDMADTKVKTALAWLERAGLLQRTENRTRIFPSRSGRLNLEQAKAKIDQAGLPQRKRELFGTLTEIIYNAAEDAPVNTDQLCRATGSSYQEIQGCLHELEQLGVLNNDTHITVSLRTDNTRPSHKRLAEILTREEALWQVLKAEIPEADQGIWQNLSPSALCRTLREVLPADDWHPNEAKQLLNALAQDKDAHKHSSGSFEIKDFGNDMLKIRFKNQSDSWEDVTERAALRRQICQTVLPFLIGKTGGVRSKDAIAETTFGELKTLLEQDWVLAAQIPADKREQLLNQALLFMHRQDVFKLNHGITVLRHAMTLNLNQQAVQEKTKYLQRDYQPLQAFYGEKRFQIHVMLEYAKKALENIGQAWTLVGDYFQCSEKEFKDKWFKGRLKELEENVSKQSYDKIVGSLNETQRNIVTDRSSRNRLVLAGPGSGKTRVIVARVAYLLKVEHTDPAAIIVLTFNRHAAQEIKRRLFALAGPIAAAVTVLTYDSMAMRLLGVRFDKPTAGMPSEAESEDGSESHTARKVDTQLEQWCAQATALLTDGLSGTAGEDSGRDRILAGFRYILVDEYQDITERHYQLVSALAGRQLADEDSRLTILAVGDDDQNIYAFNGSSNQYIQRFCQDYQVEQPDFLTFNYRSSRHIIHAANSVIQNQAGRLKALHPIVINPERKNDDAGGIWAECDTERQGRVRIIRLPFSGSLKHRNNLQIQAVAQEIRRLQALGAQPDEMAVLARNHDTLKPMQAWCEHNQIAYTSRQTKLLKPGRLRPFVRLLDAVKKSQTKLDGRQFAELIRRQPAGAVWQKHFEEMAADFIQEHGGTASDSMEAAGRYSREYLTSWLYGYTGELKELRHRNLYIGTMHSVKGLEFKHVFILDNDWEDTAAEEQRLFYVGMTRAVETLTLLHHNPRHAWLPLLPPECDTVEYNGTIDPTLDTEYRTLTLGEIDIGFAGRSRSIDDVRPRLKAVSRLDTGAPLTLRRKDGRYEWLAGGEVIGRTSQSCELPPLPPDTEVRAAEFYVQYRAQNQAEYLDKYPEELEKWTVVIPQIVISPQR